MQCLLDILNKLYTSKMINPHHQAQLTDYIQYQLCRSNKFELSR